MFCHLSKYFAILIVNIDTPITDINACAVFLCGSAFCLYHLPHVVHNSIELITDLYHMWPTCCNKTFQLFKGHMHFLNSVQCGEHYQKFVVK